MDYKKNWRCVEWTLNFLAVATFFFSMFTKETYKKIILKHRAMAIGARLPEGPTGLALLKLVLGVVLFRPIRMLLTRPIIISFTLYLSFTSAVLFGFPASIPVIFSTVYNVSHEQTGLPFIAITIGCFMSIPTKSLLDRNLYQGQYRKSFESVGPVEWRMNRCRLQLLSCPTNHMLDP